MMEFKKYGKTYNAIARSLSKYFIKDKKEENIVFSPMSVVMLLGIAAGSVAGKTRDEILKVLPVR